MKSMIRSPKALDKVILNLYKEQIWDNGLKEVEPGRGISELNGVNEKCPLLVS
jgi:hypothetical protein